MSLDQESRNAYTKPDILSYREGKALHFIGCHLPIDTRRKQTMCVKLDVKPSKSRIRIAGVEMDVAQSRTAYLDWHA